jgi:hypothetical protein
MVLRCRQSQPSHHPWLRVGRRCSISCKNLLTVWEASNAHYDRVNATFS